MFQPKKMHHTSTRSAAADESAKKKKSGVWNNDTYLSFTGELCVSDGQSSEWRAKGERVVGRDVQGRATAASAASTEGGENSPSERTLFFASAGTVGGEKLPSDRMLFFGGTRASLAHNHSVARSSTR